jgi:site-specific DNA recombinase
MGILKGLLDDSENLASIAVDAAKYYERHYKSTGYLAGLEQQRRDVEKGLVNFVKAIEAGIFNETTQRRMAELEAQKEALDDAIGAETVRQSLFEDEPSIKAYFDRFLHADFDNPDVRDSVLEYFVDKIYLYEDRLVLMSWYSEDNREVPLEVLNGEVEDPFAEGEAAVFDCFPSGPTIVNTTNPRHTCLGSMPGVRFVCYKEGLGSLALRLSDCLNNDLKWVVMTQAL